MCASSKKTTEQPIEELLCPIRHTLSIIGGKWKMPIICLLSGETPLRNSVIKRKLGNITNVMLSKSLKELEETGVVYRKQYNEVPPRVEYGLTDKGKSILPILGDLAEWAIEDMRRNAACDAYCDKCSSTT